MYFYLKEPKSEKNTPIYIIFFVKAERKNFKYSTGQKINPIDWDFDSRYPKLKRGTPGKKNKHISSVLDMYRNFLNGIFEDLDKTKNILTKDYLKRMFDKEFKNIKHSNIKLIETNVVSECLSLFIVAKNKSKGQSKSWNEKYRNLQNKIILFNTYHKTDLIFENINDDWIDEYCGFLRNLPTLLKNKTYLKKVKELTIKMKLPKVPYNDNTLNRHINFLFTFLNWSKGKHHNLNLDKLKNPIKDFAPDDIHLTSSEIELLELVELPRDSLIKVRDMFLIGVYSGQRFSDYSVFEKADVQGNMIIKRSEKTERNSFIPLHPKLSVLLEKYDWRLPKISGQKFNIHIREVCRIAKIIDEIKTVDYIGNEKKVNYKQKCDMVSSHTARRTFITLSSERGMPDHIIMKITGIRDPKTLMKYKKTSQQSVSDFANKIWG